MHKSVKYNCRVIMANKEIVLIRPKVALASDGNYREARWFAPWQRAQQTEKFTLPDVVRSLFGQVDAAFVAFGVDRLKKTTLGNRAHWRCRTCDQGRHNVWYRNVRRALYQ